MPTGPSFGQGAKELSDLDSAHGLNVSICRRTFGKGVAATTSALLMGSQAAKASGGFDELDAALDGYVANGSVPGLVALVARGDTVHVHAAGVQNVETDVPMQRDTIFAVGALVLGWFILGLKTGWSFTDEELPYARDGGSPVK